MSSKERIGVILNVDAEVSKAKGNIESLSKIFDGVGGNKGNQLRNILADIGKEYEKLADESGKTMTKIGDFSKAERSTSKLNQLFGKLGKEIGNIGKMSAKELANLFPEDIANKVGKASEAIKTFNTILENSGKGKGAISQATKEYEAQEKAVRKAIQAVEDLEKVKNGTSKKNVVSSEDKNDMVVKVEEAKAKATELKKVYKDLREEMEKFEQTERENAAKQGKESMFDKGTQNYSKPYRELRDRVEEAKDKMNEAADAAKNLNNQLDNMVVVGDLEKDLQSAKDALVDAQNKAALLKKNLDSVSASEFNRALDEAKKKLQGLSGIDLSKITNLDDLNKLFDDFTNEGIEGLKRGLQQAGIEIKELDNVNDQLVTSVDSATAALKKQNQALDDINGIKNRILQFFSLTEGVQLARRVISQATEAIRELDKAMTETATVTDFSVGDMWDALPRYTQAANELGATTLGAYETMTLFYQQGLDTNAVFEIGTETMKMARIAGLDYAEATDLMTAALRGFNMELNETSAQRVNDVYSELAAITAADTEEIANAMTKTASIANSANMEFETTAALLSQIVETTREPAETAGTAMKTIIARFTEMKKATSDIIDVDGEEVDVNKVEAALKSAGVALRDVNGEFRDLDDVFLELASRWDSLDIMTQRYIATMAAGSRQQSRFIAMMSDYDRTMELVDAAYDSAGASAKQFAKTQDSFEAKTNNLKNAWQEYLLSLANSDVVKGAIDALTKLINVINDLTEGGSSFQSSILKIFTAIAGFKSLGSLFGSVFSSLPSLFTQEGQTLGGALSQGIQSGVNNIKLNFPFIGTLRKELNTVSEKIEQIKTKGRDITFGNLRGISGDITNLTKKNSGNLGKQMNSYLQGEFTSVDLTSEGKKWADDLIDGFTKDLAKTGRLDTALDNLQTEVRKGLQDPNIAKNGAGKKVNVNKAEFDKNGLKDITKQANQAAMALSSVGMAFSVIGSKLSEQSGALGKFGHGLEVVGNSASMAGMALMTVNTIAKTLNVTLSKGILAVVAIAASAITLISGFISKQKELKKEAQQLTIETAKNTQEEVKANRELANNLDETIEAYKNGIATKEQVAEASEELISKYGLENHEIELLTGNYEALTTAIKAKIAAQEQENYAAQISSAQVSRDQLFSEGNLGAVANLETGADSSDEIQLTESFKSAFQEIATQYGFEDIISAEAGGKLSFSQAIESFTQEQLINFGKFQERYLVLLGETLRNQGLSTDESEIYKGLTQVIGDTSSTFDELTETVNLANESLIELAAIDFEKEFDISKIQSKSQYDEAASSYAANLRAQDPSLSDDRIEELVSQYFSSFDSTKKYAQAQELILKLKTEFNGDENGIEIYKKYLDGEISPEEFLKLMVSVDIETNDVDAINQQVYANQVSSVVTAPYDFSEASKGISDYINENFTIEGIDETTLSGFESWLKSISSILPSDINVLEAWNQALQGGTIEISNFLTQMQSLLNTQSLLMSETMLNKNVYGIEGTDEELASSFNKYNNAAEDKKGDIARAEAIKFGIEAQAFIQAATNFGKSVEEMRTELQGNIAAAQKKVDDLQNPDSQYSKDRATEREQNENYAKAVRRKAQIETTELPQAKKKEQDALDEYTRVSQSSASTLKDMDAAYEEYQKTSEAVKALEKELKDVQEVVDLGTVEVDTSELDAAQAELDEAKTKLDSFEGKEAIKVQMEIEGALMEAEQLTTLQTQFAKLKEITKDGFKIDLTTFNEMRAIAPEIAIGVERLADGTLDVSAGMEILNEKMGTQIATEKEAIKTQLEGAVTDEKILQTKIDNAIAALEAEIEAIEASSEAEVQISTETVDALNAVTSDGAYERALLYEQEAEDQGDAAQMGATNVINAVGAMDTAYQEFGETLDTIHTKLRTMGKITYTKGMAKADIEAAKSQLVDENTYDADKGNYNPTKLSDDVEKYKTGGDNKLKKEEAIALLKSTITSLEKQKGVSVINMGDLEAALSGLDGGGNNFGTSTGSNKGSGGGNKDKNTTNTKLENIEQKLKDLDRKREKGQINALEYQTQRNNLLTQKHGLLETDLNQKITSTKGAIYYDKKSDSVKYNSKIYDNIKDDSKKNEIDKIYKEAQKICDDMNKIEDEVGNIEKNQSNDTTNEDQKLDALERKRKKGEISADEYEKQKGELLTSKYGKLSSEFYSQLENNPEKDFFSYDEKTDTLKLNEKKYGQLSEDRQKEVKAQFDDVNEILQEMNTIEDELGEINEKVTNDTTNNESKTEALDRQLERGKVGAKDYSAQMSENLKDQQAKLQREFNKKFSESADKSFFKYDKALDTILIDEQKLALLGEEQRDAVLQEYQTLKDINDELNDVEDSIKEAKKYLKYSTTNTDSLQQALSEDLENGNLDPATYQKEMKAANKAENRTLKGENNSILKQIAEDVGPIFYNTQTRQFEWNPMFDKSTLTPEQIEMIETWMNGEADADGNRTGGKNAELKAAIKSGDSATINAIKNDYRNSGYGSLYYKDATTGALQYDDLIFDTLLQAAKDVAENNVSTYNSNNSQIKTNQEENEDLTVRKNAKKYDTQQYDYELEDLERQYQNGTLSHSQYEAQKRTALENKKAAALAELAYQTSSETSDYANLLGYVNIKKDDKGNIIGISGNESYYKLEGEAKQKVDEFIELLRGLCGTAADIDATIKDPDFKDDPVGTPNGKTAEQKRAEYNAGESALWNNQNAQSNLEDDRYDLSRLEGVVGQLPLPQELQTALGMGFTAAEMGYEAREIVNLNSEYASLNDNRKLMEATKEYVGSQEQVASTKTEDENRVAYFDPTTNTYVIDEKKAKENLSTEEYAKMMEEVEELNSNYAQRMKTIMRELSGGIIQKGMRTLGTSLTSLSKAFEQEEDGTYKVSDALDDLETALGLASGSLDGFESTLTKIVEGAGKVSFKSLGKDVSPLTSFLESKNLGGVADLFNMVLGSGVKDSGSFTGADLLGSASGAMGQLLEVGSGFMNWDMITGGVEMFTQGIALGQQIYDRIKAGIEKIKQVIEQVIQYISQATQVLVDAWTNREDYLYNYLKLIEKHLQEYERLQRYSTQIQKGRIASADDIAKNWEDQWASLQKQLEEQTERLETRQQELDRSRWNPFMLISGWDPLSDTLYENREVKMLWDIIIGLGEAFAPLGTGTFFSQLNQLYEDYDQRVQQSYEDRLAAEQALLDIEDERLELVKVGADEATQFEDKVLQAFIQKEQQVIDELSRLNDAVTTANQKLMSTLQDNLSKIRQDRENEKKEEELGEKERRLAYLRQDTSGANQMEIKRLEEELEEGHEDYTDTLIDQKISELEKQNELAAEQRQQQIDLLQSQLDYAEKYGLYWETIYDMLYSIDENGKVVLNADNFDLDGNIRENSQLAQLLGTHSDRIGMSTWQSVLDNEETKLLGLYYKAFMTRNGADGNWADYWALLDPGANDPDYTRQMAEIPDGLLGVLYKLEIGIREYFGTSNPGLVNMGRSAEQGLKNFFGKLFNYEPWETFKAEEFNKAYVEAKTIGGIHQGLVNLGNKIEDSWNSFLGLNQKAAKTGNQTTDKAKSNNNNNYGTQNYGAVTENYNFNIGTVGENISLDEMADRVVSAIKGMFTTSVTSVTKNR